MTYYSYEALVRRAVRDHQRSGRAGGGDWVVATQASGPLQEPLRAGYGAWLRTTAITGLASALLVPPAAASPADAPGLPATNPQAIRLPRLEASKLLEEKVVEDKVVRSQPKDQPHRNRHNDPPHAAAQLDQQSGTPVSPVQKPPPAHRPTARPPTVPKPPLADPKPRLPLSVSPEAGVPLTPRPKRVDAEPALGQRSGVPSAPLEERAIAARPRTLPPERIDQWATTVRTAMQKAPRSPEASRALVTLAEVSLTPRMGWSYRVQPGDTLWRISTQLWADNSSDHSLDRTWRVLHEWNRDVLGSNSNRIYPGQVLEIPADVQHVTTTSPGPTDTPRKR